MWFRQSDALPVKHLEEQEHGYELRDALEHVLVRFSYQYVAEEKGEEDARGATAVPQKGPPHHESAEVRNGHPATRVHAGGR